VTQKAKVLLFVAFVCSSAAAVAAFSAQQHQAFPSLWPAFVFVAIGILLELTSSQQKAGGLTGSIAFLIHLAAPLIFGGFWACLTAGFSVAITCLIQRKQPIRILFNTAQTVLAVGLASSVFTALVPSTPPSILTAYSVLPFDEVLRQLAAFLLAAAVYFATNSGAVSTVVVLSSGQPLSALAARKVFNFLGYDLLASLLALIVAGIYVGFDSDSGLSRFALLAVFVPVILARHMYGKLNTLQILYGELDRTHERLELALREQLEMMVKSIEARDPYTSGHSRRVAALSKAIAVDLGFAGDDLAQIENAALLHDVGKIHAEFAPLLQKEGRLTQEEWEIMKTHASKSAELVGLFSRFRGNVQSTVHSHHERWDGKGYPDGLVGADIPLGARIIMVSDTIDAMTTDRPYRKALPFEKVVAELQKYSAIQFDPELVEVAVSSVTVRRLVSDKEFLAEQTIAVRGSPREKARPALRSQSNFLDALRGAVGVSQSR
jgi:HD-GYP domain-containing protein (c-di-GMP phosphodiesterase class II)